MRSFISSSTDDTFDFTEGNIYSTNSQGHVADDTGYEWHIQLITEDFRRLLVEVEA